jgi:hypothetical protein
MNKTQLIVFTRPNNARKKPGTTLTSAIEMAGGANGGSYYYQRLQQPNIVVSAASTYSYRLGGKVVDLYDNVSIPINYTILDIREPEKRKTSWSKTITIPGTKNNNIIFSHIYQISSDSWTTIAGKSVYQSFNPNLRTEVILLNDGIQVFKGNMQLKKATKDRNGNVEYEIAINGDLTSLFFDIGDSKLNDLDFSEWNHQWSKENVVNSWSGINVKNGLPYNSINKSVTGGFVKAIFKESQTGRLSFTTNTAHTLSVGDFVRVDLNDALSINYRSATGEWRVMSKTSTTFTVNYPYPYSLPTNGVTSLTSIGTATRMNALGEGYVYPMVSWGDETDVNTWPVTSFAPGFYMKGILDKIFEETNSSYESDFFDSQFFKRLILIQKKTYDLNPAEIKSRKFWVGLTQSYTTLASGKKSGQSYWIQTQNSSNWTLPATASVATQSIFPSTDFRRVPFAKESGFSATQSFYDMGATQSGQLGNWNESTYLWRVTDSGEYALSANLKLSCKIVMDGYSGNFASIGTASFSPNNPNFIYYPVSYNNRVSSNWKQSGNGIRVVASLKLKRNGYVTTLAENTSDHFYTNANSTWSSTNPNWKGFGTYQPDNWIDYTMSLTSPNTYFSVNDEVWTEVKFYVQSGANGEFVLSRGIWSTNAFHELDKSNPQFDRNDIRGNWFLSLNSTSYIFNDPTPKAVENSLIEGSSFLPKDMSCKDFLISLIKMFNLHIEPDKQVERKYYIEPRDDYYYKGEVSTDFVDWTDKIDNNSIEILPMGELIAKYYTFEFKAETDYWNKKFKDDRGRDYSYYKKEINNDFLKNEVKVSIPLGSTVMVNYPEGSDVVMPSIVQQENNISFKPVSNSAPRVLFWGGVRPYTAQRGGALLNLSSPLTSFTYGWELISSFTTDQAVATQSANVYPYYPYAGTVDSPQDPHFDINWFNMESGDFVYWDAARWTNSNLYNQYWSNMINEISDPSSKVIIANVRLTPKDINNLDFRKIYVIEGNWLRLQKVIDYDAVTDGLTKCEFLKLISPSKFMRQNIVINNWGSVGEVFADNPVLNPIGVPAGSGIVSTVNNVFSAGGANSIGTVQYAPSKKRPNYGWNNTTPSASLSMNSTIQTTGLSNFVASSSKNININGDENVVSDGASNINITAGNGNFVSGNVKNVNVIGTNKKFITESDVTYINDIRFKNGSPISKANVIDALADEALIKQSNNTTCTVVDAGEDTVIEAGSTSFENLVDAGRDAILPDVLSLGITTLNNPNPRTNSSNGYDIVSPTYSIVEYVRRVAFEKS